MSYQSESIGKLADALTKCQAMLPSAKKDGKNPHFKSEYATLASVWDAIREPMAKNGLSVTQTSRVCDGGKVIIRTTLMHTSGEWIAGELALPPVKQDPQAYGSAITYARRYSLAGTLGVCPDDDDAEMAMNRSGDKKADPAPKPKPLPKPDPKDNGQFLKDNKTLKAKVEAMIGEAGINRDFFKQWLFSIDAISVVNDAPSMNTMSAERARGMVDKWDAAVDAYNKWMKKQQGVSE